MQTISCSFDFMPEIEDAIFECAAGMFPDYAPTLALVSKRAQTRVEYIIYESLLFKCLDDSGYILRCDDLVYIERFEHTLRARPAAFFATRVRNVCITLNVPKNLAALILSKCTGTRSLAHWLHPNLGEDSAGMIIPLSSTLTSLYTSRFVVSEMAESGVVFPNMRFLGVHIQPLEVPIPSLEWLPALTTVQLDLLKRVTLPGWPWLEDVKMITSTTSQLQFLFLDVHEYYIDIARSQIEGMKDPRIVVRNEDDHWDRFKEWRETWSIRTN